MHFIPDLKKVLDITPCLYYSLRCIIAGITKERHSLRGILPFRGARYAAGFRLRLFYNSNIEDMAERANDTPFGLAANIWTANLSNAHKLARMLDAGTVAINTGAFPPDPNMPFGGFKRSGFGCENGKSDIDLFTESKIVIMWL